MGRWEPGAQTRLREAAWTLFSEKGYDETTVAEIAARAGLSSRTFFRYFPDKSEVLFADPEQERQVADELTRLISSPSAVTTPFDALALGLREVASFWGRDWSLARQRHHLIHLHPDLTERESAKIRQLADVFERALVGRGTPPSSARLLAHLGVAILQASYLSWLEGPSDTSLLEHINSSVESSRSL